MIASGSDTHRCSVSCRYYVGERGDAQLTSRRVTIPQCYQPMIMNCVGRDDLGSCVRRPLSLPVQSVCEE